MAKRQQQSAAGRVDAPVAAEAVTIDETAQYLVTRVSGCGYLRMLVDLPGGSFAAFEVSGPGDLPEGATPADGEFSQVVPGIVARELAADARLRGQFTFARVG